MGGSSEQDKQTELLSKNYKEQAIWFLNAYQAKHGDKNEEIWGYTQKMAELDDTKGMNGSKLNELSAHRFLEKIEETLTVLEMRQKLRKLDLKTDKFMSLTEYLILKYSNVDQHFLINAPQSDNTAELDKAQQMLNEAEKKLRAAQNSNEEALKAEKAQKAAKAEEERALASLKAEEKAYANKTSELERKTQVGGIVSRNRAKNELEQHKGEDPLPLRRAKINQEASVRKSERATEKAKELRITAEKYLENAKKSFDEAEQYLNEIKSTSGSGQGTLQFIERELEESKKYLPQSKGGVFAKK